MSYQKYQQPQYGQSTSTAAMEWNGSAWVPAPIQTNVAYSHYSSQFASAAAPITPSAINNKGPVALYTEYYHGWQEAMKQYERAAPSTERRRNVELALYYANESSRAAHHYYENPNVPPPFQLPPAPPVTAVAGAVATGPSPSSTASISQPTKDRPASSLTSYIKRCLDQCPTIRQRQQVQTLIERRIAAAIQANELHTKDWSSEPLILVGGSSAGATTTTTASSVTHYHHGPGHTTTQSNSNDNDYGPPQAHHSTNTAFVASSISTSHYSPPPASSSSFSTSYYGPVAAADAAAAPDEANSTRFAQPSLSYKNRKKRPFKTTRPYQWQGANDEEESNNDDDVQDDGMDRSSRALLKRQARFGLGTASSSTGSSDLQDYSKYMGLSTINSNATNTKVNLTEEDYERMTVKGECQTLEKDYLRLTAPPKPEMVRPESILRQHLHNLVSSKNVHENDDNSITSPKMYASKDYLWMCSQYKALRQDLTIQRIQNDLAVDVYEAHARLALREGDLNEFNQCQTQLPDLYSTNPKIGAIDEFRAYRLLYHVYLTTTIATEHAAATLEITKSLAIANPGPALQHALDIRRTVVHHNYPLFFRLHEESPNLGKYLTERMVPTMRFRALKMIVKAYRPWLELEHCQAVLGFGACVQDGQQQQEHQKKCRGFLDSCGAKVEEKANHGLLLLTKESDDQIHEPAIEMPNSLLK